MHQPQIFSNEVAAEQSFDSSSGSNEGGAPESSFNSNTNKRNAKIIFTANITIETKTYDQCIHDILRDVKNYGGYAENINKEGRRLYSDSSNRSAELVVRIPSNFFETFIEKTDKFGNVISESVTGENISDQYADIEARVKVLKIRQERLMDLMKQSSSLEYLFEVEKELANVGYEIEMLTGSLKKYDNLVDYSTISISVREVEEFKEIVSDDSFVDKVKNRFIQSVESLVTLFKALVIVLAALVPYIIFIACMVLVVIIICKILFRKSDKKQKSAKKDSSEEKN